MKFSNATTALMLVVSSTICSQVTAFCGPQQSCSKAEAEVQRQFHGHPSVGPVTGAATSAGTRSSNRQTRLLYAPKRQEEESKTKLHYVSNRKKKKKEDSTDLYYAPSTNQEYEIPFVIDKFITSSGKIINPFRESESESESKSDNGNDAQVSNSHEQKNHHHHHHYNGEPFYFANILPSINKNSHDEDKVLDMVPNANVQNNKDDEVIFTAETKEQPPYDDLPTAIGYATSLSIAYAASGMTMAAKALAAGLEGSAKVSQHVEDSFAKMAVEIKPKGSTTISNNNDGSFFDNIGERIRQNSKDLPSPGGGSDNNPLPELVQALIDQADKVVSSSSDLWNYHKKRKVASVPPPSDGKKYYSPFEACNILYQHEMDKGMDKPRAMKIMLDKKYVPVGRSQLYNVFRQFKEGKITEEKQWGQRGRPRKVSM